MILPKTVQVHSESAPEVLERLLGTTELSQEPAYMVYDFRLVQDRWVFVEVMTTPPRQRGVWVKDLPLRPILPLGAWEMRN